MSVDLARLVIERCQTLGTISEEQGRLTRRALTPAMREAHNLVTGWMRAAGMVVHEDSIANLVATYPADRSAARTLLIGSHLDTVRDAGIFDGVLGVLIGLAAVEQLHRAGRRLPFAIELVAFSGEEGLRFRSSFMGSRAMAGCFDPAHLTLCDGSGVSLADALVAFGGDPTLIPQEARRPQDLLGYLEVYIEQGPILDVQGLPVGIVNAITGISRARLTFTGSAGHAGTVPMRLRHDALCGAAEFVVAVESHAYDIPGLLATVGELAVAPGVGNVIPGQACLCLDLRHHDDQARLTGIADLHWRAAGIAATRSLSLRWDELLTQPAVLMSPSMRERLSNAVAAAGVKPIELPSGAGHDAAIMAAITDAAMLFVRCKGGISHNPGESVTLEDVALAIDVLGRFLQDLALSS
ncbi:MAG: allantoate amidohydrolase [Oscillochloris sp.]|nr:allantoate amidohydrolase [Oscillochloris sp.]